MDKNAKSMSNIDQSMMAHCNSIEKVATKEIGSTTYVL